MGVTAMRRGAFLDLNGTLVLPVQATHPRDYHPLPGVAAAVRLLTAHGFACPVITVQSRIGKGLYSAADFAAWFAAFQADLAGADASIHGPYVCPHPFREPCACKKLAPYLYEQAARDLGFALADSVAIGDTLADVRAGRAFDGRGCLVRAGWGERALREHGAAGEADHVATDILAAARWAIGAHS